MRWWDADRQSETGWGRGRDDRGGNGAWGRCGEWNTEMGGLGYTPPGFRTVLKGLGASTETAAATVEAMENLLRKTTRTLWSKMNTEQHDEEKHRGIKEEQKRDPEAAKEWREKNPTEKYFNEEEVEEGEPGMITRDERGKALKKACMNCKMIHGGTDQKCKRCHTDLPSGARLTQNPMTREHVVPRYKADRTCAARSVWARAILISPQGPWRRVAYCRTGDPPTETKA